MSSKEHEVNCCREQLGYQTQLREMYGGGGGGGNPLRYRYLYPLVQNLKRPHSTHGDAPGADAPHACAPPERNKASTWEQDVPNFIQVNPAYRLSRIGGGPGGDSPPPVSGENIRRGGRQVASESGGA